LQILDVSKSNGPDGISAKKLKCTSCSIAFSLTKLFNISNQSGSVPYGWKFSMIVPIPKDGEKYVPTKYRPIPLFLFFPKSWSITFRARSCYIYKLRTQLVINNGSSVQKNPQSMHFSQLWMTGSNHLRQELTLELFFSTSLRPSIQCFWGTVYLLAWGTVYLSALTST